MGTLVIKDLPESVDLDRQAMAAITGGARIGSHQTMLAPRPFTGLRVAVADPHTPRGLATVIAAPPRPTLLR
ncbi:hypothetical protein [Paraburkholderia pallida]|nr:hypothetical protein [Paraburkholderia pallida]